VNLEMHFEAIIEPVWSSPARQYLCELDGWDRVFLDILFDSEIK